MFCLKKNVLQLLLDYTHYIGNERLQFMGYTGLFDKKNKAIA